MTSERLLNDQSDLSLSPATPYLPIQGISDIDTLSAALTAHRIPIDRWGRDGAKDLEDLLDEVMGGEAQLVEQAGRLVRKIEVARISVSCTDKEGMTYELFEDRQVFKNGAVRRRPTAWAVWEKCLTGEIPAEAAVRGIQEELKISDVTPVSGPRSVVYEPPMDYPGIPTVVANYDFKATLNGVDTSRSFIEEQEKKFTVFSWRCVSGPMTRRAQELQKLTLDSLREHFLARASEFHQRMLKGPCSRDGGVFLSETFTSGQIAEALSSFDGSSRYLRGACYPSAETLWSSLSRSDIPFRQVGEVLESEGRAFLDSHHLAGDTIFSNCAVINLPYAIDLFIGAGMQHEVVHLTFDPAANMSDIHRVERARLLAGIITLEQAMPDIEGLHVAELKREHNPLSSIAAEARSLNSRSWNSIQALLNPQRDSIVIGESFTFGKLARIMGTMAEEPSLLRCVYGWYDPEYKVAIGIDRERVEDRLIAEPETVIQGVHALINNLTPEATVAIGTSGWANVGEIGKGDHFSVASLIKEGTQEFVRALRLQVDISAGAERSFERRELTRELGVTASLLVLIEALRDRSSSPMAAGLISDLSDFLALYGSVSRL